MHILSKRFWASATLVALFSPISALAALPSITNLEVMPVDDGIELTWDKVNDPTVTHYKVYYSTQSIIDNDGAWEGYEETSGLKERFVFKNFTPGQKLFTGVTAVNAADEESEFFEEEVSFTFIGNPEAPDDSPARTDPFGTGGPSLELEPTAIGDTQLGDAAADVITLDDGGTSFVPTNIDGSLQVIQDEATNDDDPGELFQGTLKLLGARAIAPTRVSLTFSHFISISDQDAPNAFKILDPEGAILPISTLTIDRADVILETAEQEANRVYQIIVSEPLLGIPNLPLDPISRQVFFRGHTEGLEASVTDVDETAALFPPDVHDLVMTAEQGSDGMYHVETTWKMNGVPAGFVIRQTRDGGRTFSPSSRLPTDFNGVELDGVIAGQFGLFIQTFGAQGYVSQGVLVDANLPTDNRGKPPIVARSTGSGMIVAPTPIPDIPQVPVIPRPQPQPVLTPISQPVGDDLSASGAGALIGVGMAGALAIWRRARRKQ